MKPALPSRPGAAMRWIFALVILVLGGSASAATEPIARLVRESKPCSVNCPTSVVIFIHGVTGSRTTWGNPEGPLYFPKMLAKDPSLEKLIDVYQIDFDGTRTSGPAAVAIGKDVTLLLNSLILEKKYTRIMFVAHSLGGIIARTYLLNVKAQFGHTALSRVRLVITLGTPYHGSSLTNLAAYVSANEQLRVLRPIDVNDFQQLLDDLQDRTDGKHAYCASLRNFAAFEMEPVFAIGVIVTEQSATQGAYQKKGFRRNHLELPTPISTTDEVYVWTHDLIKKCVGNDAGVCPPVEPHHNCPMIPFQDFR